MRCATVKYLPVLLLPAILTAAYASGYRDRGSVRTMVVSTAGDTLSGAAVFSNRGTFLATVTSKGVIPPVDSTAYPLTIRCIGYADTVISAPGDSLITLRETSVELPEIIVSKKHNVLHTLAYVREYSTLTTYSDTVTLFREKWIDFMIPAGKKSRFKGWLSPRLLSGKSYYRFTDSEGLDSVSDVCNYHFSWSDWISLADQIALPSRLHTSSTDTVRGKYSPSEIWTRNDGNIAVKVDILADTTALRWVPRLAGFLRDGLEFDRFRISYNYSDPECDTLQPRDLESIALNIESMGRGRGMFRFNRRNEQFFVSTYAEIYVADKEYISEKEARQWASHNFGREKIEFPEPPAGVPDLQPGIAELVKRVEAVDHAGVRLKVIPDQRLAGLDLTPLSAKQRLLKRLKGLFGIR